MAETAIRKREGEVSRVEHTRDRWTYCPNVDILEKDDELLVLADVPGVKAEDLDVEYENGLLTIHGKVEPRQDEEKTRFLRCEYGVGDFYRTFRIGEGIDHSRIHAELKNGVMELHLPKTDQVKPRKITVKVQ